MLFWDDCSDALRANGTMRVRANPANPCFFEEFCSPQSVFFLHLGRIPRPHVPYGVLLALPLPRCGPAPPELPFSIPFEGHRRFTTEPLD